MDVAHIGIGAGFKDDETRCFSSDTLVLWEHGAIHEFTHRAVYLGSGYVKLPVS